VSKPEHPPRRAQARRASVDPARLTAAQAAKLVHVPPERIESDIRDGAPVDDSGRVHLIRYAAWLLRELSPAAPRGAEE
jgi:hypothetical protein